MRRVFHLVQHAYARWQRRVDPEGYARSIGVTVGRDCRLMNVTFSTEPYLVTIGDHVEATSVHFETHDGGVWVFREEIPGIDVIKRVTVGSNVYIGFGSIVLPGVTIGDNVVIGAGSVVSRDIPSNSVAVGVPARVIKSVSAYKEKAVADGAMTKLLSPEAKRRYYEHRFRSSSSVDG